MARDPFDAVEWDDETDFKWKSKVSSWMRAIHQLDRYRVRKAFQKLYAKIVPKHELYGAFERHGRLVRGFNWLRRAIHTKRSLKHRRRNLLRRCFIHWLVTSKSKNNIVSRRGALVFASFKWLSLTICRSTPQYFSQWIPFENDLGNRVRHYLFGYLSLSPERAPLLLHATAVLDAFVLRSCFLGWARHSAAVTRLLAIATSRRMERYFHQWRGLSLKSRKCRRAEEVVYRRYAYGLCQRVFLDWMHLHRTLVYLRLVWRPRVLHRALCRLRRLQWRTGSYVKASRALSGRCQRVTTEGVMRWQNWTRWHRIARQVSRLAAQQHTMHMVKSSMHQWIGRVRCSVYLRMRYWGLDEWAMRRRRKGEGGIDCAVLVRRPGGPSGRNGPVALWLCGRAGIGCVLSTAVRVLLRRWVQRVHRLRSLTSREEAVRDRVKGRLVEVSFGAWVLHGVHLMGIRRSANRVVINRFRRLLGRCFTHWKQQVDDRDQLRRDMRMREVARMQDLQRRLEMWQQVAVHVMGSRHFLAWKKYVWHRKLGKVMRPRIVNFVHKQWKLLAFRQWNAATYEDVIACCLQKVWRGYSCRRVHHRAECQYIRWIVNGGHLRGAMRMSARSRKRRALNGWLLYVKGHRHARELRSNRVLQRRALGIVLLRVQQLSRQRRVVLRAWTMWEHSRCLAVLKLLRRDVSLRRGALQLRRRRSERRMLAALRLLGSFLPRYAPKPSLAWRRATMSVEEGHFSMRRYLQRWHGRARRGSHLHRMKIVSARLFLLRYRPTMRAWRRRAHRWARSSDHPILVAHRHYIRHLRTTAFSRFREGLGTLQRSFRQQWRLVATIDRKYNRKRARTALAVWYRVIVRRRCAVKIAIRVTAKPKFAAWRKLFLTVRNHRVKIFRVRVKVMRRIARGVFLAWSLYAIRSSRLRKCCHAVHNMTLFHIKQRAWEDWRTAHREVYLQLKEQRVYSMHVARVRAAVLRHWLLRYRTSSEQTWQNVQITFGHWAQYTEDNRVGRRAHILGEAHHTATMQRAAIACWRQRCRSVAYLRQREFAARKFMLMSHCVQMLRYWRCWSWWMGRRVLYGRVRVIGFEHTAARETPDVQSSRFASTPMMTLDRTTYFDFSMSPAYYNSQSAMTPARSVSHWDKAYRLDEDPRRDQTGPGSARYRALHKKHFKLTSRLLVKGRTPLAYEAACLRTLRMWRR